MACLTNQIIHVCAFLTNFQPALVPLPNENSVSDVEEFFDLLSDSDYDDVDSDWIIILYFDIICNSN